MITENGHPISSSPREVQAYMKEANERLLGYVEFPFRTRLSFRPLIQFWKRKRKSAHAAEALLAREIIAKVEAHPELLEPVDDYTLLETHRGTVELLLAGLLPQALMDRKLTMISKPFDLRSIYFSPSLQELMQTGSVSFGVGKMDDLAKAISLTRASSMVLNRFYGQQVKIDPAFIFTVRPNDSALEQYYKSDLNIQFVEIVKRRPLKELSQKDINRLLSNIYDQRLWREMIPPENFEFHGVVRSNLIDVTEEESLSRLKYKLLERDAVVNRENILVLQQILRSYFQIQDLRLGLTAIDYPVENSVAHKYKIRHDFLADQHPNLLDPENAGSSYEKVCRFNDTLIVEDLTQVSNPTPIEVDLVNSGIRSLIVSPLTDERNRIIGLLELGSPRADTFNSLSLLKMKDILPLFCIAIERSREEIENQIQAIIREAYTAIHPSVEWKFVETSFNLLERREKEGPKAVAESISFDEVYPLYGQADIVGSSTVRNQAIQADFIDNLNRIKEVLSLAWEHLDLPILHQYLRQADKCMRDLGQGISSDDESRVMEFIRTEVHPVLDQIRYEKPELARAVDRYYECLDPVLGIVHRERKSYEDSVTKINEVIADLLDEEDRRAQRMLPHYFEKYKTDGVEYDLYIGQSLLKQERFSKIHLRNIRLWQLLLMCRITRRMAELKPTLSTPLDTAQLVFVYGSPLSIQFRMDEKQFDVDGAYNVRYEIIKKRVDKALIDGTEQRLTLPGRIAIVYTAQKDRLEYLEYLEYLLDQDYITPEIEDLALAEMQGVQGLKALRVTVKI